VPADGRHGEGTVGFVLSKILWPLLAPSTWLAALIVAATFGAWAGRWRLVRTALTLAFVLFIPLVAVPAGAWLLRPLEDRFPAARLPDAVDGIVVLGGSFRTELSRDRDAPQVNEYSERVFELMALATRYPEARIVFTGGNASIAPEEGTETEADVARRLLASTGFDAARVRFEAEARNTYENALYVKRMVEPAAGETWLLVTSAQHMPRAVGCFRRVGFPVLPVPVDYQTRRRTSEPLSLAFSGNLRMLDAAVREWVGLIAYRLMDRTDALLPAPAR
jgi:uncharacterized SAM-binding protein YcdF (DUF218 family)